MQVIAKAAGLQVFEAFLYSRQLSSELSFHRVIKGLEFCRMTSHTARYEVHVSCQALLPLCEWTDEFSIRTYVRTLGAWIDSFFEHTLNLMGNLEEDIPATTSVVIKWEGSGRYSQRSEEYRSLHILVLDLTESSITYQTEDINRPRDLTTFFASSGRSHTRQEPPDPLDFHFGDESEIDDDRDYWRYAVEDPYLHGDESDMDASLDPIP